MYIIGEDKIWTSENKVNFDAHFNDIYDLALEQKGKEYLHCTLSSNNREMTAKAW